MYFNTCVENVHFIMVLWETAWGKMTVKTIGSVHVFIKVVTLTCLLQVNGRVFPKLLIFIFFARVNGPGFLLLVLDVHLDTLEKIQQPCAASRQNA